MKMKSHSNGNAQKTKRDKKRGWVPFSVCLLTFDAVQVEF